MNLPHKVIALLACLLAVAGCAAPVKGLFPPKPGEKTVTVYVMDHGYHTSLVLKSDTLSQAARPEWSGFRGSKFVEFGWGEYGFYHGGKVTFLPAAKALFWFNPSVLHVVAMDKPPETYFPDSGIVRVTVSGEGYRRMCDYLAASYSEDASGHQVDMGKGIYGESRFYRATGHYYFPNTCNVWTARALRAAGAPISPASSVLAGSMFSQVEHFGVLERKP